MEIKNIKSGELYAKSQNFYLPAGKKFRIEANEPYTLTLVDDAGEIVGFHQPQNNVVRNIGTSHLYSLEIGAGGFWTCDFVGDDIRLEHLDNTPIEVDIENPPTLIERMQQFIRAEMSNKYGKNSDEVETWEDAQDFLMDDADGITSPYEMVDMAPEPPPLDEPEPVLDPPPAETPTEPVTEPEPPIA